jgi:hypothetical protein
MSQRHLKAALRAFAIVAGLFGVLWLYLGIGFFILAVFGKEGFEPLQVLMAFFLIPGIYLIWVVFLVWRRFSARAVLHLCGGIGFLVWTIPSGSFDRFGELWSGIAWWVWLVVVISGYRSVSRYLVRRLFVAEGSVAQAA